MGDPIPAGSYVPFVFVSSNPLRQVPRTTTTDSMSECQRRCLTDNLEVDGPTDELCKFVTYTDRSKECKRYFGAKDESEGQIQKTLTGYDYISYTAMR
jgi:hypothetical protein